MAPKPKPWFRLYVEMTADRKIRRLPIASRWIWVVMLACARSSPKPGWLLITDDQPYETDDIADAAAATSKEVERALAAFVKAEMVEQVDGCWRVVAWDKRQFEGDSSTERSRRSRSRQRPEEPPSNDDATLHRGSMQRPPSVEPENREQIYRSTTKSQDYSQPAEPDPPPTVVDPAAAADVEQESRRALALWGQAEADRAGATNPGGYAHKARRTAVDDGTAAKLASLVAQGHTAETAVAELTPLDPLGADLPRPSRDPGPDITGMYTAAEARRQETLAEQPTPGDHMAGLRAARAARREAS